MSDATSLEEDTTSTNSAATTALSDVSDQELRVPCYCEENVWRLAYRKVKRQQTNTKHYYAVFVSNPSKCVCFFHQRANDNPLTPVFWDYHVLLFELDLSTQTTLVLDVDSYLPYPISLTEYLDHSFPAETSPNPRHQRDLDRVAPWFRIIPAEVFLEYFQSDRRHMWNEAKQTWMATPPSYNCIQSSNKQQQLFSNLMTYIDMEKHLDHPQYGKVMSRKQLREKFG